MDLFFGEKNQVSSFKVWGKKSKIWNTKQSISGQEIIYNLETEQANATGKGNRKAKITDGVEYIEGKFIHLDDIEQIATVTGSAFANVFSSRKDKEKKNADWLGNRTKITSKKMLIYFTKPGEVLNGKKGDRQMKRLLAMNDVETFQDGTRGIGDKLIWDYKKNKGILIGTPKTPAQMVGEKNIIKAPDGFLFDFKSETLTPIGDSQTIKIKR
jgi:lipopolysaccharide export system protein LptA